MRTTVSSANAMQEIITVLRPELSQEETEKRMQAIKQAAIDLVVATAFAKARKAKMQASQEAQ